MKIKTHHVEQPTSLTLSPGLRWCAKVAGLAVLLAPLPGCQGITGSPKLSQVRMIDASPDAGGLDVYQGTNILAYNLGQGTITSYVAIAPGGYSVNINAAGTKQQLATASGTFGTGNEYTVLVGNSAATLQELILKDQAQPAPSGQISLRFVDQAIHQGALDVYLVPSGSTMLKTNPILTGITFNTNTGYLNIPTGTYTLNVVPAGTVPTATGSTLYTSAAVVYLGGSAKTVVLIDATVTNTPAVQVVTGNDYDPAGEQ